MRPTVLIVAPAGDVHAKRVGQELRSRAAGVRFFDVRSLGNDATVSYRLGGASSSMTATDEAGRLDFCDIDAVWFRRPGVPFVPPAITDIGDRRFARTEWRELVDGVFTSMRSFFVNPLLAQYGAVKPRQLETAQRVGLRIPDTLITSDPTEAASFVEAHSRVVHKAMSPHPERLLETQQWTGSRRPDLALLRMAPTIFQEEVEGYADVRITVVGNQMFSALVESDLQHVDFRLDPNARCTQYRLSADIESAVIALMKELGLIFGTIDMRVNGAGEHFFLEVNPQGQFLYIEILTGMPIAAALADLLTRQR